MYGINKIKLKRNKIGAIFVYTNTNGSDDSGFMD